MIVLNIKQTSLNLNWKAEENEAMRRRGLRLNMIEMMHMI